MPAPERHAQESSPPPPQPPAAATAAVTSTATSTSTATATATATCPLCGQEFRLDAMGCHDGCPLARRCAVLCCPHCGYEFVDEGPTRRRLARIRSFWYKVTGRSARQVDGSGLKGDRKEGSPR